MNNNRGDYPAINAIQLKEMLLEDWHPPDRKALIEALDARRARAKAGQRRPAPGRRRPATLDLRDRGGESRDMRDELAGRRALLVAALGFTRLRWREPAPAAATTLTRWLHSWTGLGRGGVGMARQGYRLHLTNIDEGVWRATLSRSEALAHDGFGAAPTPWRAVQRAAWEALTKAKTDAS